MHRGRTDGDGDDVAAQWVGRSISTLNLPPPAEPGCSHTSTCCFYPRLKLVSVSRMQSGGVESRGSDVNMHITARGTPESKILVDTGGSAKHDFDVSYRNG